MRNAWLEGMSLEEASAIAGRDVRKAQGKVPNWPTPVRLESNGSAAFKLTDAVEASLGKTMPKMQKNPQMWEKFKNWPTPAARDGKPTNTLEALADGRFVDQLANRVKMVENKLWTTPCARDWGSHTITPKFPNGFNRSLVNDVLKFPTPQASDCRDRGNMSNPAIQRRAENGKQLNLSMVVHPTSGQLNPTWVEWLMGWPLGWTDLKPLETDKCPSALQQHGGC
jgi:DNA (cytosine-5)-methyltransferase 1